MFDFYKPEWFYEALPYIYTTAGITTIVNLDNALSRLSGGLLISAGVFIWWMRRTYRQNQKRMDANRRAAERRAAAADRRAAERRRS